MKLKRPRPFSVGHARIRAIRGPHETKGWYYRAQVYEDGAERTIWTGWSRDPLDVHRSILDVLAVLDGEEPEEEKTEVVTVQDLMEVWAAAQDARSDISRTTRRMYVRIARGVVRDIGKLDVARMTQMTIEALRDRKRQTGAATTASLELGVLVAAWRWGRARGLVPNTEIRKPRVKGPHVLTRHTPSLEDFWAVVGQMNGRDKALAIMLGCTGCRIGEIVSLTWEACDLSMSSLTVTGKTGPRTIPVTSIFWDTLEVLPSADEKVGRVFAPAAPSSVMHCFQCAGLPDGCAAAGVERFTPHGIRRMVVDRLYISGVDISVAASLLGHSPTVALSHYRTVRYDAKVNAIELAGIGVPSIKKP